jgi:hypothetical protein
MDNSCRINKLGKLQVAKGINAIRRARRVRRGGNALYRSTTGS